MALSFLVDTSVLERLARPDVRQIIEPLAVTGQLARAAVSDLEVGYSARNLLAQRSRRGRKIPDLLIAAAAEELDLVVLYYDADFDLIASVSGQRVQWVVPAGSVD